MSEHKEWALAEGYSPQKLDSVYGFDEAKEYFNKYELENPIHVIEYAAFEKLQKDWEEAATKNYADKCEIEKLKKQNEIMRESLEFYADKCSMDDFHRDYCGETGREALKDVEGVK